MLAITTNLINKERKKIEKAKNIKQIYSVPSAYVTIIVINLVLLLYMYNTTSYLYYSENIYVY